MPTPGDYMNDLLPRLQDPAADPQRNIELLTEAAQAHPNDARPLLLLAAEFMERRDVDRAEASYVAALQRAPAFAIARFQLGLLQFTCNRPVVAMATWGPLDALPADDPLRIFKRAFEALSRDEFGEARHLLLEGMALNTVNAPLNHDMQMLLRRIDEHLGTTTQADDEAATDHFLVSAYRTQH